MIVDDDKAIRELLQLLLRDKYDVITASNGEEAVRVYKDFKPELVLMDIMMPIMDGVEATKEIIRLDPSAKIVGITAYAQNKGKDLLEAGAKEILEKPFTRKKLIETIEKYLK